MLLRTFFSLFFCRLILSFHLPLKRNIRIMTSCFDQTSSHCVSQPRHKKATSRYLNDRLLKIFVNRTCAFLRESVYYSIHKEGVKRILKSSLVIKYIPPIWLHISLTLVSRWCSPVSVAFTCLFNRILVSCHITNEKLKQTQIALFLSEETRHVWSRITILSQDFSVQ